MIPRILVAYVAFILFVGVLFSGSKTDEEHRQDDEDQIEYLREWNERKKSRKR